jgi:hypothetical protein
VPKKKKSEKPKQKRPARIGPFGPDTEINWSEHGADRAVERLHRLGLDDGQIEAALVTPIGTRRDEWDPQHRSERVRRWSMVQAADGSMRRLRFVFRILRERTPELPGSIAVVTVIDEGASD